jgi:Raf kinase inhibitor-like YbhB/YbcL family protein
MIAQALAVSVAMATLAGVGGARAMTLTSPDVEPGARIPDEQAFNGYGCPGKNVSPALSWSGAPADAKSFALTLFDPDAPGGGFWHWAIFNIPADVANLPKGAGDPHSAAAPKGATQSRSDFGAPGYGGPCPPKGDKPHRYQFTVYAVDVEKLDADERASAAAVGLALKLHTLAKATLTGLYGR